MLKGILLGGISALVLSAVLISSTVLMTPPPQNAALPSTRLVPAAPPAAAAPAAPVVRTPGDTAPRMPDRPAAGVSAPLVNDGQAVSPMPVDTAPDASSGIVVPPGSEFGRPPEDGAAVTPQTEPAPRTISPPTGLGNVGSNAADAPEPQTRSAAQPAPRQIVGFGIDPEAGDAPRVPGAARAEVPQTLGNMTEAPEVPGQENTLELRPFVLPPVASPGRQEP